MHYALVVMILIPLGILFMAIGSVGEILTIILIASGMTGAYILATYLIKGVAKIKLEDNQLEFEWIKKPPITTLENRVIKFKDIGSWKFREESQYTYFTISPKKANDMTIYRDSAWFDDKDDFASFLKHYKKLISDYNEEIDEAAINKVVPVSENTQIKSTTKTKIRDREEEFYSSWKSVVMYYVYIATSIFGTIALIINWKEFQGSQIVLIASGIGGCIFLINMHHKKRNKNV